MANDEQQRPLAVIVGERLKAFRAGRGLRQADVAAAAEKWGLPWARSSIAALEAGTRNLSLEEALLLPFVISELGGWDEPLVPPNSMLELSPTRSLRADMISAVAQRLTLSVEAMQYPAADPLGGVSLGVRKVGQVEANSEDSLYGWQLYAEDCAWRLFYARSYSGTDYNRHLSHGKNLGSDRELIGRVAKKIENPQGGPASYGLVNVLSWVLWRSPFEVERDRRTTGREGLSERGLQSAKGHATREMIAEMQVEASSIWSELNGLFGELAPIWDDAGKLESWAGVSRSQAIHLELSVQRQEKLESFEVDRRSVALALEAIGWELREARTAAGKSVQDVAERMMVAPEVVEAIEEGAYLKARSKRRAVEYLTAFALSVDAESNPLVHRYNEAWQAEGEEA